MISELIKLASKYIGPQEQVKKFLLELAELLHKYGQRKLPNEIWDWIT